LPLRNTENPLDTNITVEVQADSLSSIPSHRPSAETSRPQYFHVSENAKKDESEHKLALKAQQEHQKLLSGRHNAPRHQKAQAHAESQNVTMSPTSQAREDLKKDVNVHIMDKDNDTVVKTFNCNKQIIINEMTYFR
jgi:hypothetical protein